jgi:hypothetical protein
MDKGTRWPQKTYESRRSRIAINQGSLTYPGKWLRRLAGLTYARSPAISRIPSPTSPNRGAQNCLFINIYAMNPPLSDAEAIQLVQDVRTVNYVVGQHRLIFLTLPFFDVFLPLCSCCFNITCVRWLSRSRTTLIFPPAFTGTVMTIY